MYPGERFNSITHLVGSVLALIGTSVLVTMAVMRGGGGAKIAAVAVYALAYSLSLGVSLVEYFSGDKLG